MANDTQLQKALLEGEPEDIKAASKKPSSLMKLVWDPPVVTFNREESDTAPHIDAPVVYLVKNKDQDFSYVTNKSNELCVYPPVIKIELVWPKGTPDKTTRAEFKTEKKKIRDGLVDAAHQAFINRTGLTGFNFTEFVIKKTRWSTKGGSPTVETHFALAATPK